MSSFYFYRWNQFKVIPLACSLRTRKLSQILCDIDLKQVDAMLRWRSKLAWPDDVNHVIRPRP